MAISHATHDHPNTPAARAACRKQMAATPGKTFAENAGIPAGAVRKLAEQAGIVKPAKLTVVPRRKGDGGVVQGMKDGHQGVVKGTKVKAYETRIKTPGDLPGNIPSTMVSTIMAAWNADMPVVLGHPLNGTETRILIGGVVGQVSLVFNAGGDSGIFVRSLQSSITHRVDSGPQALALATGEEEWPWMHGAKMV